MAQLAVIACDKMPLTAPLNSTVTVATATPVLPIGGSTEVSAFVSEGGGTPVQNGTVVRFTTTLGRVDPVEAQTSNGLAITMFHAGDVSGVADIRATSGAIAGGTAAAGATPANGVQISVGAAAVDAVVLRANHVIGALHGRDRRADRDGHRRRRPRRCRACR